MYKKELHNYINSINYNDKSFLKIFRGINKNLQGRVILNISNVKREKILKKISAKEIAAFLHYLDPDEATDIIQQIKKRNRLKARRITNMLTYNLREKVEFLLRFDPKSAAGIMSLDYIEIELGTKFTKVARMIKKHEKRTGKIPALLVVENNYFVGELPIYALALYNKHDKVDKHVKKVPIVNYNADENEVVRLFRKNSHNKIIVIDDDDSILGVIYSDDIIKLMQKKATKTIYNFAGVYKQEDALDSFFTKVKNRYSWLILNLFTAFLAAFVVSFYQKDISKFALLAVYMPIVAGMGGNAGTQTMAVIVRGLALKEISKGRTIKVILNELMAGAVNGLINGAIVAAIAWLFNKSIMLGFIVGISMILNLMIAGFFGTIMPLILKRLGKDPATSSTIFITTATDVVGFFVFLELARILI